MLNRIFILSIPEARQRAMDCVKDAPEGYVVKVGIPNRNLEQNAAMWPLLDAFAKQKKWPVNGESVYLDADSWKDILSAAFKKETVRVAQGLDGGVVMLGKRTSQFGKKEFSEFLDFLNATAVQMNIDLK